MLPYETQALIRILFGGLLFILLSLVFPFAKIYFVSEKYHGCIESSKWNDRLFTPTLYYFTMGLWLILSLCIIAGIGTFAALLINLIFCRIFFIQMRWTSPLRGMGAPGFMTYWLSAFLFFLEYSHLFGDSSGQLTQLVIFTFQFDYGIMMMDSGFNKIMHGYPKGLGMNYGMANPAWGYWPETFRKFPPHHFLFKAFNHSAYFFQILGGFLMLFPATNWIGAAIIFISFGGVKCFIRLGVLCDMLMLIPFIYTSQGGWLHTFLMETNLTNHLIHSAPLAELPFLNKILSIFLWVYILSLPLAKLAMYGNLYLRKTYPRFFQRALELFTNFFGVILWHVFTVELIDFFVRVHFENKQTGERTAYTRYGFWKRGQTNRFLWVGESIMSLIVFNTEKYFPNTNLFHKRLLRYAKTMPCPAGSRVLFEYIILVDEEKEFSYVKAREVAVEIDGSDKIEDKICDSHAIEVQKRHNLQFRGSIKPGSYSPIKA